MPDFYDLPPSPTDEAQPGSLDYDILLWCNERLKRGIEFIESQIGYDKVESNLKELFKAEMESGASYVPGPKVTSKTSANLISGTAENLVGMLTDTRCFWEYKTENAKYAEATKYHNKDAREWYTKNSIDLRIGDVMRDYTVAGTGVAHLFYSKAINDMMLEREDPRQVFPVDPMSYHGFEDCLGAIVRRPRTPEWIRQEYGKIVSPESGGVASALSGWLRRMIDGPASSGGPLSKKSAADKEIKGTPINWVNTLYIKDHRKNKTSKTVRMGPWDNEKPLTPWSYEVKPGSPLYPFRRMIAWTGMTLLQDGPSPYWHSKFPLIKFTLNPWPGSWFGKAPLTDCVPLQRSITSNLRVIDDHCGQVAEPAATADRNVSKAEFAKVNTRAPGMKVRTNSASGKGIQIHNPPPLDTTIFQIIEKCEQWIQKISGTFDPSVMTSLGQLPSDDTIDTLMKTMTPGIRLRSRILEGAYKELAYQYLYCSAEFDTVARRLAKFGPKALTKEDFDYMPGTLIPDDVPDGEPGDVASIMDSLGLGSPSQLFVRAKVMLLAVSTAIDPSSLLNTAAQQDIMKYFMLAKMGYCSVFTLMEKLGETNFAPPNLDIPPDEISRLQLQQTLGIGMIANAQGRKATDAAPPSMGNTGNGPTIQTS